MALKILFVSGDSAPAKVMLELFRVAKKAGDEIVIASEALSTGIFKVAGYESLIRGPKSDKCVPFWINVAGELRRIKPDIVVVGQSSPIHLEQRFADVVRAHSIPLATVEDSWRGCRRILSPVDLCLVVDSYSATLALEDFPGADIAIVGNIGAPTEAQLTEYQVPVPELEERRRAGQQIIFYGGGGARTTPELEFLMECFDVTTGDWVLVTRWHPKRRNDLAPDGRTCAEFWEDIVRPLGDRFIGTLPTVKVTEQVTANSDIVVSSFMNSTIGGVLGKINIVLGTPESMDEAVYALGLPEYPQAALGIAHELVEPANLLACPRPTPEAQRKIRPFDAELAYKQISEFATNWAATTW